MADSDVMTLTEWGQRVKLSPTSAWRRMRDGVIEVVNVGSASRPQLRVTEEAHRKFLAARRVQPLRT